MQPKGITIHCSDSPNDRDIGAADIHQWHLERGWDGIGYHYVIRRDGKLEHGRPEYWTGSHAKGHNDTIGVCLVGTDSFTEEQKRTLVMLLENLCIQYKFSKDQIKGHRDYNPGKTCPNFDVETFVKERMK